MPYADPEKRRERVRFLHAQRRAEWFSDRRCVRCGTQENLQVHHRVPEDKVEHNVWRWGKERRDAELAKCEALCQRCHLDEHHEKLKAPCGTRASYQRGCRCPDCTTARREQMAEWRRRKKSTAS